ncbi:MAG: hypothetical protein ABIK65_05880 [Candidatus Eisenbacteria bacterium]
MAAAKRPYYLSLGPFVPWRGGPHPCDWAGRFGRKAPLELEIGFGNGETLVGRAAEFPERDFVGIELMWESVKRALRRIAKGGLTNVALLEAPAHMVLEWAFAPRSIDRVLCLFPCPWPKERHERNRLFGTPFLRLMNSRLEDGGEAMVVTDFLPYRDWLRRQIPGTGFEAAEREIPARHGTKYERKWSELGQDRFFEILLTKREHVGVPPREGREMKIHTLDRFDPSRFDPKGVSGEPTVRFKEFLYDPARRKGMVRVFVGEEGLRQEFWIEIVEEEGGAWKVRPGHGCSMLPTAGAQRALDLVKEWAGE